MGGQPKAADGRACRGCETRLARRWKAGYSPSWRDMQLDFGVNAGFVEELYAQYLENPESVDPGWRKYFDARPGDAALQVPVPSRRNGPAGGWNGVATQSHAPSPQYDPLAALRAREAKAAAREREVMALAAIRARVYQLVNA